MVKVRVASSDELAKIEEKLCEAVLETIDAAKRDPHWSEARAKALKRHLYAMTERVLGSVRANVLCGDEEAGKETVSEGEIADPELDALEGGGGGSERQGCGTARDDAWGGGEELR